MTIVRATFRALRWPYALTAALFACVPSPPASSPEFDSGDGGRLSCKATCEVRARAGCLEARFAAACVPTCELARDAGTYEPCAVCSHYVGGDGADHVRCNR